MSAEMVQCSTCGGSYAIGDWPMCGGNPENHTRPHGSFAPGDALPFTPVVVFKNAKGEMRYPGSSQQAPPPGFVREEITTTRRVRSLQREMDLHAKIEHEMNTQRIYAEQDRTLKARHEKFREKAKKMTPEGQGFAKLAMEISRKKLEQSRDKPYNPGSFVDAFENNRSNVAAQSAFSK